MILLPLAFSEVAAILAGGDPLPARKERVTICPEHRAGPHPMIFIVAVDMAYPRSIQGGYV